MKHCRRRVESWKFCLVWDLDGVKSGVISEMRAHANGGLQKSRGLCTITTYIFLLMITLCWHYMSSMETSLVEKVFLFGLNVAGWLWGIVSFLPWYYFVGRKQYRPKHNVQALPVRDCPGGPYRCVEHLSSLKTSLYDGVTTLDQMFKWVTIRSFDLNCICEEKM